MVRHRKLDCLRIMNHYCGPLNEMRRWGRYLNRQLYQDHQPQSIMGVISEYGMSIPSGYYCSINVQDPVILQTQRVWAFMPEKAKQATFLYYAMDGSAAFKARRMDSSRSTFFNWLQIGEDFYLRFRDTDFSAFDKQS